MTLSITISKTRHSAKMTLSIVIMLSVNLLGVAFYCFAECRYAKCRYAECRGAFDVMVVKGQS